MNSFDLNIKKKEHKLYGAFGPKVYFLTKEGGGCGRFLELVYML